MRKDMRVQKRIANREFDVGIPIPPNMIVDWPVILAIKDGLCEVHLYAYGHKPKTTQQKQTDEKSKKESSGTNPGDLPKADKECYEERNNRPHQALTQLQQVVEQRHRLKTKIK